MGRYDDGEDPDDFPPIDFIQKILDAYKDAPSGYAIDVGQKDGVWALVEINDGWALGLYKGMSRTAYVDLLLTRWEEILKAKKGFNL